MGNGFHMDNFNPIPGIEKTDREAKHNSPIDVHVGARMRLRRTLMGMSQERLGDALGLTFQQVQKYERGVNRVSASRLYDLARVLDVPISFFYDDMPDAVAAVHGKMPSGYTQNPPGFAQPQEGFGQSPNYGTDDALNRRETLELVRAYYRIPEPAVRKRFFELVKSLSPEAG